MSHEVTTLRHGAVTVCEDPALEALETWDTEVALSGRHEPERLVVSERSLEVFGGANLRLRRRGWSLAEVTDFRIEPAVGSCFLQAQVDGQWVDVLRQPGTATDALTGFARRVSALCREGAWDSPPKADEDGRSADASAGETHTQRRSEQRRQMTNAGRIVRLMHPMRGSVLLLLGLSVLTVVVELIPPRLQGFLVDHVLKSEATRGRSEQLLLLLLAIVAGLLAIRLVATLTSIWKGQLASKVGTTLTANLRSRLVEKLTGLPLVFHDRNQVGMLMSRVSYDTETLHTLVHHLTSGLLLQLFQLVGIGVMLFWINPKLALVTMLPMPFIIAGSWYFMRYLNPRHHHYWEAVGKQASALTGMLSGIRVVKAFVQEDREFARFCDSSNRLRDSRQTLDTSTSTFSAAMGFLFTLGHLAVWYIGGRSVLYGEMSLGDLVAYFMYLAMFYAPLTSIAEATTWFSTFFAASDRLYQVLDAPAEAAPTGAAAPLGRLKGRIEFRNVTFGYQSDRPVLQGVSFTVEPGQFVGVVGRSGSGKSTLVSLIGRLYEIGGGEIRIDGVDIRQMGSRELRRRIGVVLQEPFLFRGGVRANIVYGKEEASPEQILHAAKHADAHDFVMRMPFAYETQLGEGGAGLSGGERQRLSIARALVFDPSILILDEATASVDAESERCIRDAVRRFSRGRTTLAIAHRLSTLQEADRLLVFDQGRLIEQGTHEQLLAEGGLYSSLVNIQMNRRQGAPVEALAATASAGRDGASPAAFDDEPGRLESLSLNRDPPVCEPRGDGPDDGRVALRWLEPEEVCMEATAPDRLRVSLDGETYHDVCAVQAFPASHPRQYVSLRWREPMGREIELGMIRDLGEWPPPAADAVAHSINRRQLLCPIRAVRQLHTCGPRLEFAVETEGGTRKFALEKPNENVQPFGQRGLLLLDTRGRHFVIPDRSLLPKHQQRLLALYIGD